MNKYLIFRTDRIGDFLILAILIKSIRRNDPDSFINVVASEKNYNYIKSFKIVDKVTLLTKGILSKLKLIYHFILTCEIDGILRIQFYLCQYKPYEELLIR